MSNTEAADPDLPNGIPLSSGPPLCPAEAHFTFLPTWICTPVSRWPRAQGQESRRGGLPPGQPLPPPSCSPALINNRRSLELHPPASRSDSSVSKGVNQKEEEEEEEAAYEMNTPSPPGCVGTSTSKMQRLLLPSKACLSRGQGALWGTFPQLTPAL